MTLQKQDLKSKMKQSLGGSMTGSAVKKSIFDSSISQEASQSSPPAMPVIKEKEKEESKLTKADIYTQRVTAVLSVEQRDQLEAIAKAIQRNGIKKTERITSNTLLRCLVDLLNDFRADISGVSDEESLKKLFKEYYSKP